MFARWAWQAMLVVGICSVVLGVVLAAWPNKSVYAADTLFGLCLLLSAAAQLVLAFGARIHPVLKWLVFGSGALAVLLAVWCFSSGGWILLLALWTGIGWMIRGIMQAIVAVWSDDLPGTVRLEAFGLATLVMGIVVVVAPFDSVDLLGVAVGLWLIVLGGMEADSAVRVQRGEERMAEWAR